MFDLVLALVDSSDLVDFMGLLTYDEIEHKARNQTISENIKVKIPKGCKFLRHSDDFM